MPTDAQVAGGHKAAINNDSIPEETKQHSKKVLEEEYEGGDGTWKQTNLLPAKFSKLKKTTRHTYN